MKAIARDLSEIADVVLFDSPAAAPVHDAATLSQIAGASLLVVREGWTSMPGVQAAMRNLSMAEAPVLGFAYVERPSIWAQARRHADSIVSLAERSLANVVTLRRDLRRVPLSRIVPAISHILLSSLPGR